MISVAPERPVAPIALDVLTVVDRVARSLGFDYFVTGAMARTFFSTMSRASRLAARRAMSISPLLSIAGVNSTRSRPASSRQAQ